MFSPSAVKAFHALNNNNYRKKKRSGIVHRMDECVELTAKNKFTYEYDIDAKSFICGRNGTRKKKNHSLEELKWSMGNYHLLCKFRQFCHLVKHQFRNNGNEFYRQFFRFFFFSRIILCIAVRNRKQFNHLKIDNFFFLSPIRSFFIHFY